MSMEFVCNIWKLKIYNTNIWAWQLSRKKTVNICTVCHFLVIIYKLYHLFLLLSTILLQINVPVCFRLYSTENTVQFIHLKNSRRGPPASDPNSPLNFTESCLQQLKDFAWIAEKIVWSILDLRIMMSFVSSLKIYCMWWSFNIWLKSFTFLLK